MAGLNLPFAESRQSFKLYLRQHPAEHPVVHFLATAPCALVVCLLRVPTGSSLDREYAQVNFLALWDAADELWN